MPDENHSSEPCLEIKDAKANKASLLHVSGL
jgi:hypothetical protein